MKALFCVVLLSVLICTQISAQELSAYDKALLLAARSEKVYETLKPVVVKEIAGLVNLSKTRKLTEYEKFRLNGLNKLRKSADDWVVVHNAYLDILGAIEYLQDKPDPDARDRKRLVQLISGLHKNNLNLEVSMQQVSLSAQVCGLKIEGF